MLYSNLSLPETPEKTLWESPAWAERELEQGEEEEKEQGFIYEDEEARMDEGVEEHGNYLDTEACIYTGFDCRDRVSRRAKEACVNAARSVNHSLRNRTTY